MLGGYCQLSFGEISKVFGGLPDHSIIRITANYHFIDAWAGETGFMRTDTGKDNEMVYKWTEPYDSAQASGSINVCGARYGEGKFSSPIDISFPHVDKTLKIAFGATIDQDPCDESYGISNLNIFIM